MFPLTTQEVEAAVQHYWYACTAKDADQQQAFYAGAAMLFTPSSKRIERACIVSMQRHREYLAKGTKLHIRGWRFCDAAGNLVPRNSQTAKDRKTLTTEDTELHRGNTERFTVRLIATSFPGASPKPTARPRSGERLFESARIVSWLLQSCRHSGRFRRAELPRWTSRPSAPASRSTACRSRPRLLCGSYCGTPKPAPVWPARRDRHCNTRQRSSTHVLRGRCRQGPPKSLPGNNARSRRRGCEDTCPQSPETLCALPSLAPSKKQSWDNPVVVASPRA